jgi:hypothetical protein
MLCGSIEYSGEGLADSIRLCEPSLQRLRESLEVRQDQLAFPAAALELGIR